MAGLTGYTSSILYLSMVTCRESYYVTDLEPVTHLGQP
jgi:hypothetical protein